MYVNTTQTRRKQNTGTATRQKGHHETKRSPWTRQLLTVAIAATSSQARMGRQQPPAVSIENERWKRKPLLVPNQYNGREGF